MASPKLLPLFFSDKTNGAPLTGLAFTFDTYRSHGGVTLASPTVIEVGNGAYYFVPAFPDQDTAVFFRVRPLGTTSANPAYYEGAVRPEDYFIDNVQNGAPYVQFAGGGETVSPVIFNVVATRRNSVTVKFSEPVVMSAGGNGALNVGNYQISSLTVFAVSLVDDRTVQLTTSTQQPGTAYNLTVLNVEDLNGNPIASA